MDPSQEQMPGVQETTRKQNVQAVKSKAKVNEYGSCEYWQERYKKCREGERFDWLEDEKSIMELIESNLGYDHSKKILNVGCGNGAIQEHLYEKGYTNIINNDISKTVIDSMEAEKEARGYKHMQYQVMDATDMQEYADESFDMVLDKSTLDALTCSDEPYMQVARMLHSIYRILKPDGVYLIISYSTPANRLFHIQRQHVSFSIEVKVLEKMNEKGLKIVHHAFICHKKPIAAYSEQWLQQFYRKVQAEQSADYD